MYRKVTVTGGCGFIGSHLVDALVDKGFHVSVIDNQSANNEVFYKNKDYLNTTYHLHDIAELDDYHSAFDGSEAVFHLAAESRIGPCNEKPELAVRTNVVGTQKVLEMAVKFGAKKFIYSSTSSVYGRCGGFLNEGIEEDCPIDCLNNYSLTKYEGENLVRLYKRIYGIDITVFRYFNVFGERCPTKGQYAPVTGIFLDQLKQGKPLTIVGSGEQRRDFVHVSDVVEANILAFENRNDKKYDLFNIGTGYNVSINEIAAKISKNIEYLPKRQGEMETTLAKIGRAYIDLGFLPKTNVIRWIEEQVEKI